MYYPDEIIEDVRVQNDIVDVIGAYVHLTKKGASHFGLCPFHNEKSPSFSVSKDKQMYYCFGCGAGGNVFTFMMAYENFTFVEAVKELAKRAHIELPEAEMSQEAREAVERKNRLYEANRLAARYYYRMLRHEKGEHAMRYVDNRGLSDEIKKSFGLGYATAFRDDLLQYLRKQGYNDQELMTCGLLLEDKNRKGNYYDRFFNRLMFPIFDVHGKVIAFGGRVLGEGQPKYLNSPETVLFDKSRNLYGLNIARRSRKDYMIIAEGYMDVIALHQAGFDNAIASLGTAFTGGHGHLIKRYVDEVIVSFDSDEAGVKATLRSIGILRSAGLTVRVIEMDTYKDPDEYIKNKGPEAYQELIDRAIPSFMFEIKQIRLKYNRDDPEDNTRFSNEVAKKLLTIEGKIERDYYVKAIVKTYELDSRGLYELMGKFGSNVGIVKTRQSESERMEQKVKTNDSGLTLAQKELLAILVTDPKIFHHVKDIIKPEYFTHETLQHVALIVFDIYMKNEKIEPALIMSKFTQIEDQKLIAGIFGEEIKIDNQLQLEKLLNDTIRAIKGDYLEKKLKTTSDATALMALISEKKDLLNTYVHLEEIDRRD